MYDEWLVMRPQRIRAIKPPFQKVPVSPPKRELLRALAQEHPEWVVHEYITHAETVGVTLTTDEVWSALYPE